MKRTVVEYQTDGKDWVKLVGFKNAASLALISSEFGFPIRKDYQNGNPRYTGCQGGDRLWVRTEGRGTPLEYKTNQVISKAEFTNLIGTMKTAGRRLGEIVGKYRFGKTKNVII